MRKLFIDRRGDLTCLSLTLIVNIICGLLISLSLSLDRARCENYAEANNTTHTYKILTCYIKYENVYLTKQEYSTYVHGDTLNLNKLDKD